MSTSTYSDGDGIWDVERLYVLSADLPVVHRKISEFPDWDFALWDEAAPTLREHAEHMKRVQEADLSYPVILSAEGWLMDGAHRLVKAWLAGHEEIATRQFPVTPEPDSVTTPSG